MGKWQKRWNGETKVRWTYKVILIFEDWVGGEHGDLNFYLAQVFIGHGCSK